MKRFSTHKMLVAGISVVVITIGLVLFISIRQSQRVRNTVNLVDHTEEVLNHIQKLVMVALDNETGARGFVITGKENYLEPLHSSEKDFQTQLNALRRLVSDNPRQLKWLDTLEIYVDQRIAFSDSMAGARKSLGLQATVDMVESGRGKFYTDNIRRISREMENIENELLAKRKKSSDATIAQLNTILYGALAAVTMLSVFIIRRVKTDITRQKASEEKYSTLFNSIDEGFCIIEMIFDEQKKPVDYRFLVINAAFERQTGLSDAVGKRMREFAPGHEEHWFETYGKIALTGESIRFENRAEQLRRWYDVYAFRFGDPKNCQVAILFNDITENKKAQEQLQEVNKELESFTYSVSHDLRAPLRIIDGYADILITDYKEKLDEEGNRVLGIVKRNARRMGQLIDDLLNLSQTGRKELTVHYTDMNKLVRSVVDEQFSHTGDHTIIKLRNLEPAQCDSALIRQVWVNLISNGVKYSGKQDQPVIEISSVKTAGDIIYAVKDNGVGFDMKYADKLFGVFQRLHKISEFEGTGIGLALVNRILAKHQGKIWAEAALGQGATFFFSLPVLPVQNMST